ncbi:hypothetical protein C2S53_014838 [Perilla frutescens var. hirtella]|uniref:Sinapine esterase n=1 Tax=Perilla frutescens var. hirtella TaxID=608512 RepID=A0AAD4J8X0_PERFH|nr:hypothetical protein C2S53_014838 [Perilla frutescens var. hirtella]
MQFSSAIIFILLAAAESASGRVASGCYESIVSFGDSLTDTGNYRLLNPADNPPQCSRPPYGRTFFHHPTGRCSDGRLIIDFIAEGLGLPLVLPYIAGETGVVESQYFSKGVNLAVVGATALDYKFYEKMGIDPETNVSLGTQLEWFKHFLAQIPESRKYLEKCLVVVGEIGGNDYNHPITQGKTPELIRSFVPVVIDYIGSTIEELIRLGAERMIVPGNLAIGCLPAYLTQFKSTSTPQDYDSKTGCLNWLNNLAIYHDHLLLKELTRIRRLYPHVTIMHADYYNAMLRFYISPTPFGFSSSEILRACCGGGGGEYNYNSQAVCGFPGSSSCDDPFTHVSWDGLHLTEAAYTQIAQALLQGDYITTVTIPAATST